VEAEEAKLKVLHLVKTSVGATWAFRQMRELCDSAESFASAVLSILRNRELAARLSVNGRKFIHAHHIWESKTDLLRSLVS
jgi:hypothetical protein